MTGLEKQHVSKQSAAILARADFTRSPKPDPSKNEGERIAALCPRQSGNERLP